MGAASLRHEVDELYAEYVSCLDDGDLERWPEFFTDLCLYKIIPRENFERDLPLALMLCESKGMLKDRVASVLRTSVFAPRALRHLVSGLRITAPAAANVDVQASFAVLETPLGEPTRVFTAGRYLDRLVREDGRLKFTQKLCVLDSRLILGSLIYPL